MQFLKKLVKFKSLGKEPQRLKVLMLADEPGWVINRVVDKFIKEIPCDFDKDYFTSISSQKLLEISDNYDLIYYSNTALHYHYSVLDKIKTPILLGIRSMRYHLYEPDLPGAIKKYRLHTHVVAAPMLERFRKARFIPNGVFEQYKPKKPFVVGYAGRPSEYKGYPLIEEACRQLGVKFKPATGDVLPHKMLKYYRSIDLLVVASENEGFCNPLVECMAMNIPVISTVTAASRQFNMVTIDRSLDGIKEGILKFYTQPQVADFTWKNSSKKMFDYFYDIVITEAKNLPSKAARERIIELNDARQYFAEKYFSELQ